MRAASQSGTDRIMAFESAHAVKVLIDKINWEARWAVPLNRVLPRLSRAIDANHE